MRIITGWVGTINESSSAFLVDDWSDGLMRGILCIFVQVKCTALTMTRLIRL